MINKNKSALIYMIAAVLLFSVLQIAFSFGGASSAPLLFSAWVYSGSLIYNIIYLFWFHSGKMKLGTFKIITKNIWNPTLGNVPIIGDIPVIILVTISHIDYVFFALGLRYVDEAIAAVLIETGSILTIILMMIIFNQENDRYEKFSTGKWYLLGLALIGVGFVITSQSTNINSAIDKIFTWAELAGIGFVLAAAFFAGLVWPATQKWGIDVNNIINKNKNEIFYNIIASTIGRIIIIPILFIFGWLFNRSIDAGGIALAVTFGIIGPGAASMFFRIGLAQTNNLGISALVYLIPVVALFWLWLASLIDVARFDWLIIGLILIVTSNILLNIKTTSTENENH